MNTIRLLLAALLAMFPRFPTRQCIIDRTESIVQQVAQAEETRHVPPGILLIVGFEETHLGCDANEGGGWGAPIDARHRHTAGTSDTAARILMRSYEVCGTWTRAITRFRSGLCSLPADDYRMPYVHRSQSLINRLYARAGVPGVDLNSHRTVSIVPEGITADTMNDNDPYQYNLNLLTVPTYASDSYLELLHIIPQSPSQ